VSNSGGQNPELGLWNCIGPAPDYCLQTTSGIIRTASPAVSRVYLQFKQGPSAQVRERRGRIPLFKDRSYA
jgi:hypothetical protein